ncbi:MAG TPA: molybdopterin-guanine dinucleotide biosynthesis protein B [Alicycliphilus sp.]|nr:molybdopterin-guanine dinucleotide biosynthesis protein B [Alicycliphilus sp.]HRP21997.1 molybdopterin-guanine dinucleotide biosynthesis protein B [Alicycliphilus sp.]
MKVLGFVGYSGSGKTTLLEQLIALLRLRGLRVSVVKHAHHRFDIDHQGKDSWRHREAGAYEVVVASDRRMALMREYEQPHAIDPHELLAELDPRVDWVLVEGFKHSDLPKVEVWRPAAPGQPERPVHYGGDDHVVAVATDAAQLPRPTALPVLNLRDPEAVAQWMLEQGARFDYLPQAVEACE